MVHLFDEGMHGDCIVCYEAGCKILVYKGPALIGALYSPPQACRVQYGQTAVSPCDELLWSLIAERKGALERESSLPARFPLKDVVEMGAFLWHVERPDAASCLKVCAPLWGCMEVAVGAGSVNTALMVLWEYFLHLPEGARENGHMEFIGSFPTK